MYLALGDSITFGHSEDICGQSYAKTIHQSLMRSENMYLYARPGWTSKKLYHTVSALPKDILTQTQLVTILIGGNDILRFMPYMLSERWTRRLAKSVGENIRDLIQCLRQSHSTIILGTLYNPFPHSRIARKGIAQFNEVFHEISASEQIQIADIFSTFRERESELIDGYKNGLIRDMRVVGNPIHPNGLGHRMIADTFGQWIGQV